MKMCPSGSAVPAYKTIAGSESLLESEEASFSGSSTMTASTFNLAKNIIGGGMLALSAGMAAGEGTGYIPAFVLMFFTGLLSAYTFVLVGYSVQHTRAVDFEDLWSKTIGLKSAWVIDAVIFGHCFGVCIMYGCFLGDLFSSLTSAIPSIPLLLASRSVAIISITCFVLLPLCLLKDLSALRYSSMVGICAVVYITLFILIRYVDGTYAIGSGSFLKDLDDEFQPEPPTGGFFSAGIGTFVLFNMLTTAFTAHFNAVKFYIELERATPTRFASFVLIAFAIAAIVCGIVMAFGYATFGQSSSGLILNNYSKSDTLAIIGRVATGISIICSQPLIFTGLRDSTFSIFAGLNLLPENINSRPAVWTGFSITLLVVPTVIAIMTPNVGVVVSFIGSLLGAGMVYSIPALIHLHVLREKRTSDSTSIGIQSAFMQLIVLFGIIMTFVGTGLTIVEM